MFDVIAPIIAKSLLGGSSGGDGGSNIPEFRPLAAIYKAQSTPLKQPGQSGFADVRQESFVNLSNQWDALLKEYLRG